VPAGPRAALNALRARVRSALAPHAHRIAIGGFAAIVLAGVALGGVVGAAGETAPAPATSSADRSARASRDLARTAPATPPPVQSAKPSPTATKSAPATKPAAATKARPAAAKARPAATRTQPKSAPAPKPVPVPASCASYSGNKRIACSLLPTFGFSTSQMPALEKLWAHESGWNHKARNRSSGAYGIPQALPGSKMGKFGADWRTNPATQIKWGLSYIKGRYGTPTGAWAHFRSHGWY